MQRFFLPLFLTIAVLIVAGVGMVSFKYLNRDSGEFQNGNVKEKFEIFPARLEDFLVPPKMYGLWPYGVRGNDSGSHNEGHPGWDFELKKGSKLYAIADLKINQIHDGDKQTGDGQVVRVIEASARLKEGGFGVVYHSVINIEKNVIEGAIVKEGSILAEVGYPISNKSAMIHFGIFAPKDSVGICPTGYFSEEVQKIIEQIVANSVDDKTGKPYSSACVGKIDKEIYYKNFPDRIKYLRGGEIWE